jgi:regulator of protease activity HflC (stomatin/prohibitin superfamily)
MNIIAKLLYRPTENHVGVIYRLGRFRSFVDPDHWAVLLPWVDSVAKEAMLDLRTANIALNNVYTRNNIAVDIELKVFYFVDLRQVSPDRCMQVLRFDSEDAWDDILRTGLTDITRNSILVARSYEEISTREGRTNLKQALSSALAQHVRGFGVLVNPRFGVTIVNLQPNEAFQQALKEESAAKTLGIAAADRIRPLFEQFKDQDQEKAFLTLVMHIAAAVAKNGQSPDIIFPSNNDFLSGGELTGTGHDPDGPSMQKISQPRRPRSVAGD